MKNKMVRATTIPAATETQRKKMQVPVQATQHSASQHQSNSMTNATLRTETGDTTALSTAIMDTDTAPHHDHSHLQHWWRWEVTTTRAQQALSP